MLSNQLAYGSHDPRLAADYHVEEDFCFICTGHATDLCTVCDRPICAEDSHVVSKDSTVCDECGAEFMLNRATLECTDFVNAAVAHEAIDPQFSLHDYRALSAMFYNFIEFGIWRWDVAA